MGELRASVSVTLDSNGYGTATYFRGRAGLNWVITRFVATGTKVATLKIYRGSIAPANVIDSTLVAQADTSETNLFMYDSDILWFEWSGGTSGANMTCGIVGVI